MLDQEESPGKNAGTSELKKNAPVQLIHKVSSACPLKGLPPLRLLPVQSVSVNLPPETTRLDDCRSDSCCVFGLGSSVGSQ